MKGSSPANDQLVASLAIYITETKLTKHFKAVFSRVSFGKSGTNSAHSLTLFLDYFNISFQQLFSGFRGSRKMKYDFNLDNNSLS